MSILTPYISITGLKLNRSSAASSTSPTMTQPAIRSVMCHPHIDLLLQLFINSFYIITQLQFYKDKHFIKTLR